MYHGNILYRDRSGLKICAGGGLCISTISPNEKLLENWIFFRVHYANGHFPLTQCAIHRCLEAISVTAYGQYAY